jgi:beta-D-xylosidase 4
LQQRSWHKERASLEQEQESREATAADKQFDHNHLSLHQSFLQKIGRVMKMKTLVSHNGGRAVPCILFILTVWSNIFQRVTCRDENQQQRSAIRESVAQHFDYATENMDYDEDGFTSNLLSSTRKQRRHLKSLEEKYATDGLIGRASCDKKEFKGMLFCDHNEPIDARVSNLIAMLTRDEKVGLLGANPGFPLCPLTDGGVARLGINRYTYLVETNTGVASRCLDGHQDKCSTTFGSPAMMAASFNRQLWFAKGDVISNEMRAYYHTKSKRGNKANSPMGLHGYAPSVNLMRDPRWGRNQEVPSEDPFLSGEYAKHYIQGMQQRDAQGYLKMHASIKHFAAYNVEAGRAGFNGHIDKFHMVDTYLPAFEKGIREGQAGGAMCSYSSINGVPSCASDFLNDMARNEWQNPNFLVTTDCGAIKNMVEASKYANDIPDAITKTIKAGTDLEMGDLFYNNRGSRADQDYGNLTTAIDAGINGVTEADVDQSLRRVLYHRFDLGMFDPLEIQEYANGDHVATINSTKHQDVNSEAALQGLVLLQNPNFILPIQRGRKVAVVGTHAMMQYGMFEWYKGDVMCSDGSTNCVPMFGDEIALLNNQAGGETTIFPTGNAKHIAPSLIQLAARLASKSDVVVACVGIDFRSERESRDREDIGLEETQVQLIRALRNVSENVIVVLVNGGALSAEEFKDDDHIAIVEAFYPGFKGAEALAKALFGGANKWGLMPYTTYARKYVNEVDVSDMSFTKGHGRTYRYYKGKNVVFPFGHGLSYTTFQLKNCRYSNARNEMVIVTCWIRNMGDIAGDAILLLYHRLKSEDNTHFSHPVPLKTLRDFTRVTLNPKENAQIDFHLTREQLSVVNEHGEHMFYEDSSHEFIISTHGGGAEGTELTVVYAPTRQTSGS